MAKTLDITKLAEVEDTSVSLLGKTKTDTLAYIDNEILKDIDEAYDPASNRPQSGTAVAGAIAPLATKDEVSKQYVPINITKDGDVSYMNNEANGGLIKFIKKDGLTSKVTLFDGSDTDKTMMQLIVHDKDKTKVAKVNANETGFYYIKKNTNTHTAADELATLGDVDKKTTRELKGTKEGDVAKIQNQNDGGVMQYVKQDGSNAGVRVSDGTSHGIGAELFTLDSKNTGSRIVTTTSGAFYSVGNEITVDAKRELAVKADVETRVAIHNDDKQGNKSYMANEADGGIMKFIRSDKKYSKVGLWNDASEGAGLQLVVGTDAGGAGKDTDVIKLEGTSKGMFYAKHGGTTKEGEEITTKDDLAKKIDILIKQDNGTQSYMNNEKDGGILKYIKSDGTYSKVTLCDSSSSDGSDSEKDPILLQLAVKESDKTKKEKNGDAARLVKINGSVNGFYYVKGTDNQEKAENELATIGDVNKRTLQEVKSEKGTALISNDPTGGLLKWSDAKSQTTAGVCVNDGTNDIFAQLYVKTQDTAGTTTEENGKKHTSVRLNVGLEGIYYTKDKAAGEAQHSEDDEIVTKADLKELKKQLEEAQKKNTELQQQVQELQSSYTAAIKQVNDYTNNVKALVEQTAPSQS